MIDSDLMIPAALTIDESGKLAARDFNFRNAFYSIA